MSVDLEAILGVSGAVFAGIGLFFTALSYRKDADSRYLQILKEFSNEFEELESAQLRNTDYKLFGAKYLNLAERVAYLASKKVFPEDIARFFDANLGSGLALLSESEFTKLLTKEELEEYNKGVSNLKAWCNLKGIPAKDAPKPHPLANAKVENHEHSSE